MLTITAISEGTCTWCREQTEVVTAQFRDGLTGTFCKKHLWQALKVRCTTNEQIAASTLNPTPGRKEL
jgi:hypothetical protein